MVLFGLGLLIVTVGFLSYKVSPLPSQWWLRINRLLRRQDVKNAPGVARDGDDGQRASKPEGEKFVSVITRNDQGDSSTLKDSQDDETTPKLTAQDANTSSSVPSFTLDDSHIASKAQLKSQASHGKSTHVDKLPEEPTTLSPTSAPQPSSSKPPKPLESSQPQLSPATSRPPTSQLMPPPPRPSPSSLRPLPRSPNNLNPPPSAASQLRGPPRLSPSSLSTPATSSTLPSSQRPSKKVILPPGHSPLDWANLTAHPPSTTFLRGKSVPPHLIKVTPSQLKAMTGRRGKDAWGTWQGKVYNMTPYLKFHPGGEAELLRGAGRMGEAERLFMEIHPWVNWDGMLNECLVGVLVEEGEGGEAGGRNQLDEMD